MARCGPRPGQAPPTWAGRSGAGRRSTSGHAAPQPARVDRPAAAELSARPRRARPPAPTPARGRREGTTLEPAGRGRGALPRAGARLGSFWGKYWHVLPSVKARHTSQTWGKQKRKEEFLSITETQFPKPNLDFQKTKQRKTTPISPAAPKIIQITSLPQHKQLTLQIPPAGCYRAETRGERRGTALPLYESLQAAVNFIQSSKHSHNK